MAKIFIPKNLPSKAIIVIGNEGKGIREKAEKIIETKSIFRHFRKTAIVAESLNAAVATGIICSEFRRQSCSIIQNENLT